MELYLQSPVSVKGDVASDTGITLPFAVTVTVVQGES
jgi:hypothetical protein